MFGVEVVEELSTCESPFREELRDAVGLLVRTVVSLDEKEKKGQNEGA
jgi:hypothetical protein